MSSEQLDLIRNIIDICKKDSFCEIEVKYNEPMSGHTTFKVGGNADCYVKPCGDKFPAFCFELIKHARSNNIPLFILGGGANIVVSDNGIRGIVLDTSSWSGLISTSNYANENEFIAIFKSGTTMDDACKIAYEAGLTGLEFLAGMPGTIGGAVFMNARCYGKEIADVLAWTEILEEDCPRITRINTDLTMFGYKYSPFQKMDCLIINAGFNLRAGDKHKIKAEMDKNIQDRKDKGHYLFPCAGSAFKNNRDFGKPTGQIIDELGLCGLSIGGAQIALFHGNIVINKGGATAADIRALMDEVSIKVKEATGFVLEPEIIFVS